MNVKAKFVFALLQELREKVSTDLDYAGFGLMEEYLENDEISQKYLDDIHRKVTRAIEKNEMHVGVKRTKMNEIAIGLGYKNFLEFEMVLTKPIDPILKNCIGKWWSLVRGNTGDVILKAPVKIKADQENNIVMTLTGEKNKFTGKIKASAGSIFCDLESGKEKKLRIILKGNVNPESRVLQGIFSGISSTGDPMGGREILIRETELHVDEMRWSSLRINDETIDARIRKYFQFPEGNCIKIDNRADLG
jgi:hypothetical protein